MIFRSSELSNDAPQLSGAPALFLALFVTPPQGFNGFATVTFVALLVPLVGIAFGFDGINSERSREVSVVLARLNPALRRQFAEVLERVVEELASLPVPGMGPSDMKENP